MKDRGSGGGVKPSGYQKWPAGTRWAHFTKLPPGMTFQGAGRSQGTSKGWVRVGSQMWKDIQAYNASPRTTHTGTRGSGHGGAGTTVAPTITPQRFTKARYNPESPQYAAAKQQQHDSTMHPPAGDSPSPGQSQNDYKNRAGGTQPGTKPGKGPKSPPDQTGAFGKMIGDPNVGQMLPRSMADALAGLQFDAQIHDTAVQQADAGAQHAQNLRDIHDWYNQIQQANGQAQAENDQQVGVSAHAANAVTQSLLDAIGGSANANSGAVAAQGAGQEANIRALGAIQDQYQNNMRPALDAQQAGQMSAQSALDSQKQQGLDQTLQDLLGQRGQAQVSALQSIISQNNALAQTRFGNRISRLQAILGGQQLAGNIKLQGLQINQAGGAGSSAVNGKGNKPWASMSLPERYSAIQMLMQGPTDPSTGKSTAVPINVALQRASLQGWNAGLVRPFLASFYQ